MRWPPRVGDPLPRAEYAWYEQSKVEDWILGIKGHGENWATVFHVGLSDWERLWEAILEAAANATIQKVRHPLPLEFTCGIEVRLNLDDRDAMVIVAWHYANRDAAPRLVTAYPTL